MRNLVNAPFELPSLEGMLVLPALGETPPTRFSDEQALVMQASLALEVSEAPTAENQGGNTIDETKSGLAQLRVEYAELLGKKPFHGWTAEDLQKRIDTALAS